jgi:hypothetical protein
MSLASSNLLKIIIISPQCVALQYHVNYLRFYYLLVLAVSAGDNL